MTQLSLVYDFLNECLPNDLMSLFRLSSNVHTVPRELNSSVNRLLYIPKVKTTTYGLDSIRYHCATLWNKMFKTGAVNIDGDKKNNVQLTKIKTKKHFNKIMKKHFLYSYTVDPFLVYY